MSLINRVLFWYILLAIPFLYYHEKHLPFPIIILLVSLAILVSIIIVFCSFYLLGFIFKWDFFWVVEGLYLGISLLILHFLGILENRGGRVFLFFIFLLFLIFRITRNRVYYRSILFGFAILINGLLTFQVLSNTEILIFHYMFREKYSEETEDFTKWDFDEKRNMIRNTSIPLEFTIPRGLFFHNPKDLSYKDKTGSGQIVGIFSSSEKDPNIYPYIRIFIVGGYKVIEQSIVKEEYSQVLEFESQRGEIESIKMLGENKSENHKTWEGFFWTFFDLMRPRYSKAGFYLINMGNGNHVVLDIRENLIEDKFHEEVIENLLDSLK